MNDTGIISRHKAPIVDTFVLCHKRAFSRYFQPTHPSKQISKLTVVRYVY
jgi:hypothetical protein